MTQAMPDDLWRDFPKTATEFEARFATEENCRAYWIEARWGGEPACARCNSTCVWSTTIGTMAVISALPHRSGIACLERASKDRRQHRYRGDGFCGCCSR